ncbi:MAG: NUDIX hydrolase [Candidatus Lokiarchaeota archaeon]|nr:NUDIX hydrolase [Candidatus Lokiarchaeota archaeon]
MKKKRFPRVTIDAIIMENGKILLIQRGKPPFIGSWALPGGHIDLGEIVEDAVIREIKEETNAEVKIDKLFNVYSHPDRDPRGHYITIVYSCSIKDKNQKILGGDDAIKAQFFDIEEINKIKLAFDHKEIINDFLSFKNGKRDSFVAI